MHGIRIGLVVALVGIAGTFAVGTAGANNVARVGSPITLGNCVAAPCASTYPAGMAFHVAHGFAGPDASREALLDPGTRFELTIDGERIPSAVDLELNGEWPQKTNVSNVRHGLSGVHTLVGQWYAAGVLVQTGTRTVTFTP